MSSIVTITFSPCIDKSTTVPSLVPEKKLRCSAPFLEPGGGGINVARAIRKLGGEAIAVFPSGGYTGKHFNQLMTDEGIRSVIIPAHHETRENIIILEESTNNQYRFGMPGTPLSKKEWMQCLDAVEEIKDARFIVASGSLPPGVPPGIYARLSVIARKKNAKLAVDTSGEALMLAVKEGVYLLKPNLGELASLAGKSTILPPDAPALARSVIEQGKCEVIIVSMGAEGALIVTRDLSEIIVPPAVKKKSTVGAGDSMLAGIVLFLSGGRSLLDAARYGVACGTAATLNAGTQLCNKDDADKIYVTITERENPDKILK